MFLLENFWTIISLIFSWTFIGFSFYVAIVILKRILE